MNNNEWLTRQRKEKWEDLEEQKVYFKGNKDVLRGKKEKELKAHWEKTLKNIVQRQRGEKDGKKWCAAQRRILEREMTRKDKTKDCRKLKTSKDDVLSFQ